MAKVTLAPEFESISGKLCSKSQSVSIGQGTD